MGRNVGVDKQIFNMSNFLKSLPKWVFLLSSGGSIVGLTVLIKGGEQKGYTEVKNERLEGKTVVITGANSGIGKETSIELAKRGSRLIMACRDMEKCAKVQQEIKELTDNFNVHCKHLDLSSLASVRKFAEEINSEERRLDVLINNAGVMAPQKPEVSADGVELQLAVNHLAPFLLEQLLQDKLKQCAPSRIINVSSGGHTRGRLDFNDFNGLKRYDATMSYHNSKLAHLYTSRILATELASSNVRVFSVNPGVTQTEIGRNLRKNSLFTRPLFWFFLQTPRKGAQTTMYTVLKPGLHEYTGGYFNGCELSEADNKVLNDKNAQRTWLTSKHWVGLSSNLSTNL